MTPWPLPGDADRSIYQSLVSSSTEERSAIRHIQPLPIRISALGLWMYLVLLGAPDNARSEWMAGIIGGSSNTRPNDVHLIESNGTDFKIRGVHWYSESFSSPPYYGLRIVRWFHRASPWGVGVDFTHSMMISELADSVTVSGTVAGVARSGRERLWDTFSNLQFSNGHSILSANVYYRRPPATGLIQSFSDRLHPYAGVGIGLAIPHVEIETFTSRTSSYQIGGIAGVVNAGTMVDIGKDTAVLIEYRVSRAAIDAGLKDGGSLSLVSWTHHFHLGIVFVP